MKPITLFILLITSFQNFYCQKNNLEEFQKQVNVKFKEVSDNAYDASFEKKYEDYYTYFKKGLESHPETINYPFKFNNIFINQSKDNNVRVYSWMIQSGYLGRDYNSIIQFKSENKVLVTDSLGMNFICETIYKIPVKNKKIYIFVGKSNEGGVIQEDAYCYEMVNDQLKRKEIFINKKEKTRIQSVGYLYDDRISGKSLIKYNPKLKTFYVPVIKDDRVFHGKFYLYILKGDKLVYSGIK